jgi:CheY-like chemotaxis protein
MSKQRTILDPRFAALSVLIIDDIENTRKVLRAVLKTVGINNVTEASGAVEGYRIAKSVRPDIVFTDWDMPGATGLDFVRFIRNRPDSPDPMMPVILLTAHGNLDYVNAARDVGATDFLVKPFSPQRIAGRILDVVEGQRHYVVAPAYKGPDRRRANRPVISDRRLPDGQVCGVSLIPPDNLLAAKISGDAVNTDIALRKRFDSLRTLQSAADSSHQQQTIAAKTLYSLAGRALETMDAVTEILTGMADPLACYQRSETEGLPLWAARILVSLQRMMSNHNPEEVNMVALRLHLRALRAMLRTGSDPLAEKTAEELAIQIEIINRERRV